jgi:hypothetical protein
MINGGAVGCSAGVAKKRISDNFLPAEKMP